MTDRFSRVVAWLVFLFGEYTILCGAMFPINAHWSYLQLLLGLPGVLVAFLVLRPSKPREPSMTLNQRLFIGGSFLMLLALMEVIGMEIGHSNFRGIWAGHANE